MKHTPFIAALTILSAFGCQSGNDTAKSTNHPQVQEISILKLDSLQKALPNAILLDVRSDEEWDAGHLEGASYISYDWDHRLEPLKALPEDRPILVYCEAGGRSGVITEELRIIGHPYIIDLTGGISDWTGANLPIVFGEPVALP
jgi:rhodanese-related sulfurtransferase